MGVRYRKYFKECKPVQCTGRRSRTCPETPKRSNGEYKTCGTWCIEFFDDNKQWQSLTFKDIRNKSDAEKRLTLFISDRERGQLSLPKKKAIPTLAEYSKTYLEFYRAAKENTRLTKMKTVNSLVRYLGEYRLDKVTPFVIEKFRVERKEKDSVKEGTVNDDVATLKNLFNYAIKGGIIDKNPCNSIKKLKTIQTRDRILSREEIALLFKTLKGKDRLMVLFGLLHGLRLNEVLSLSWDNFDFAMGLLTFVQSKTGKTVTMPISGYLLEELLKYKQTVRVDRLFEERVIKRAVVVEYSLYFGKLFRDLNISRFTFHNLRHSFSSLQNELGTGVVTTKDLLGHSDLSMTLRYSHTGLESKKRAIQTLAEYVINTSKERVLPLAVQV